MSPRDAARAKWGERAVAIWYLGGFAVLILCAVTQTGPSAWAAAWQVRHWGYDNVLLAFLPGVAVLMAPIAVLACLDRRPDRPFVSGAKEALWPTRKPPTLPRAQVLYRLQIMQVVCLWIVPVAAAAGLLAAAWATRPGPVPPGAPLPEITLAAALVPGAVLPSPARLRGAEIRGGLAYSHDEVIRRGSIHDTYVPLTSPNWRIVFPIPALELIRGVGGAPPPDLEAPLEGTLQRGGIPAWLLDAMRRDGLAVTDDPLVLTREELGGLVPAPSILDAMLPLILGGAVAAFAALVGVSCWRARKNMVRG